MYTNPETPFCIRPPAKKYEVPPLVRQPASNKEYISPSNIRRELVCPYAPLKQRSSLTRDIVPIEYPEPVIPNK